MSLTEIQDFLQLSPALYTAGQPFEHQFTAIRAAGCSAVINLALVNSPDAFPEEGALVAGLGMEYIHIPVEWESPRPSDLESFFAAMQRLNGQKVFVHCARNMRVSAFVFLYRVMRLGENRAQAEADLWKIWQPNGIWQSFIDTAMNPQNPCP